MYLCYPLVTTTREQVEHSQVFKPREVKCSPCPSLTTRIVKVTPLSNPRESLDRGLSRIAVCLPPRQHAHRSASAAALVLACHDIEGSSRRGVLRAYRVLLRRFCPIFLSVPQHHRLLSWKTGKKLIFFCLPTPLPAWPLVHYKQACRSGWVLVLLPLPKCSTNTTALPLYNGAIGTSHF